VASFGSPRVHQSFINAQTINIVPTYRMGWSSTCHRPGERADNCRLFQNDMTSQEGRSARIEILRQCS